MFRIMIKEVVETVTLESDYDIFCRRNDMTHDSFQHSFLGPYS